MNWSLLILVVALGLATDRMARAQNIDQDQIAAAVRSIIDTSFEYGESSAIEQIRGCYRATVPLGGSAKLVECIAQDIAYGNLSEAMYKNILKKMRQPEYTTMTSVTTRVYAAGRAAGWSGEQLDSALRRIAKNANDSISPAIRAGGASASSKGTE